ncbi:Gfo/Idh/MocA family protein [Streptomyces lancefieldiae]|uniref:Gfo/Idh/MocA family oxidoreductase n=1 Tax=Streptomyces lancefieldiae TaxID=3075520 RepID=A0ABU3AKV9_9ACTN|nr:Gfo/Idh/MocA family oxidoreductase [Streptomyces sp. DSM 40712]MDT0610821.1 Gfo/Idh/MocA family oxidoreductase [Streptomyces sp. DSM 40712]
MGCASIAWRRTLPAVLASEHVDLVAVASRDTATAERFARRFGGAAVTGYDELLARPDVEAVYVPLPTGLHAHWCARALRAGKHVLAEKPLTASHAEAAELAALAAERGLCLTENRMFAHHPQHETVRQLVEEDAIGALRVMHATMAFPPLPAEDVRYRADLGGGALLDAGYYPLQAAMLLLTEPLEVLGADLPVDPDRGVEVRGDVLLRDARGVTAHLVFGFDHGYRSSYELWGSKGRLVLERAFTPPESWQPVVRVERQNRVEELTLPAAHQFRSSLEHFAAAVRAGGGLDTHLAAAVRGAALMDAVRRTAHR